LKLDSPRKEFFEAVSMANAAAGGRSPINILQNLKLEAKNNGLRVLGCDGEMWVERDLGCMVEEAGAVCVQSQLMNQIVSTMPDGDLHLETSDSQNLLLQHNHSEYRMLTLDPADFPEPPEFGGEGELTLPMGTLREAIDSVGYAVSTDTHRPILTGVLFNYDGKTLTLVATDTHRLAVRKLDQPGIGSNINAVVPERALRAIKQLPVGDDDKVTLKFGNGRVGVEAGSAKVVAQLLAGAYPNWERVVPSESTRSWSVETDQLAEKIKRAMILARDNANRIRFTGGSDQLMLTARSEEKGEAKEEVPMVGNNGEIEIAFNGRFVEQVLSAIDDEGVRIEMTEHSRPAIFKPANDGQSYFCVIMPMALY